MPTQTTKLGTIEDGFRRESELPSFSTGDTVKVHYRVREGEKERIQVFQGVVIRKQGGQGIGATFTVRKISYGVGVERTFPVNSPLIQQLEVARRGRVRRARLYYLRERTGKKARIAERSRSPRELKTKRSLERKNLDIDADEAPQPQEEKVETDEKE